MVRAQALDYARSDTREDLRVDQIAPTPLQDKESWKSVLPLQAADFAAWEIRKWFDDRQGFEYTAADKALGRTHMNDSYLKWLSEQESLSGKPVRHRKSYTALRKALGILPMGVLFDEFNLEQMLKCHPNGWTA